MTEKTYTPDANLFGHGDFLDENPGAAYHFEDAIDFFDATPEGDFLSNFYPSPFTVSRAIIEACLAPTANADDSEIEALASVTWPDGETFFQAFKAEGIYEVMKIARANS